MPTIHESWAASDTARRLEGPTDNTACTEIWFKSKPIDRDFCYRVAQIQLCTDSNDQGWVDDEEAGSYSWFEIAILPNAESTEPRTKDGKKLVWRSHSNRIGVQEQSRHFGVVFDRRGDLLNDLEIGDVIAVRVCVQFLGWVNEASSGYISVKLLNEDLFSPQSWTLASKSTPNMPANITDGVYTLIPTTECHVKASDSQLQSKIWFASPALDEDTIARIKEVQLFTTACQQDAVDFPEHGSFSWFDIVILDTPEAATPKIKNGYSLVWRSHSTDIMDKSSTLRKGNPFVRGHDMLSCLEVGNAIAVRVCAQFAGWENNAENGELVIRISNRVEQQQIEIPDLEPVRIQNMKMQEAFDTLYKQLAEKDGLNLSSTTTTLLSNELRADQPSGYGKRPIRLLSLDGGGVRGISSLRVLRKILGNVKPCEYFDMIGGTSTGGLIAIMLGRLQMDIEECEKCYREISEEIFGTKMHMKETALTMGWAMYDAKILENVVRRIVKEKTGDENTKMLNSDESACKVVVMSILKSAVNNDNASVRLRTYVNPKRPQEYPGWSIWEAARATSAAPLYFESMRVGEEEFIDGGLLFNNPVSELVSEALTTFGDARPISCLLTIGTGIPPNKGLPNISVLKTPELILRLISLTSNCEVVHNQMKDLSKGLSEHGEEKYWRFNVGTKVKWIETTTDWLGRTITKEHSAPTYAEVLRELDDWKNIGSIADATDQFLKEPEETAKIASCASKLQSKIDKEKA